TQLAHPNIVQFCDANLTGEMCYFAMEFVEGIDLGKHVRLGGRLRLQHACDSIRQTALGLQHAYERNLVHRDIKPANLFLVTGPMLSGKLENARPSLASPPVPLRQSSPTIRGLGHKVTQRLPLIAHQIKIIDWGL